MIKVFVWERNTSEQGINYCHEWMKFILPMHKQVDKYVKLIFDYSYFYWWRQYILYTL